jgi:hypothetical protein
MAPKTKADKIRKSSRGGIMALLLLAALTLLFFRRTLFFGGDYIIHGCDLVYGYYFKTFYRDSLLHFRLPLWNPYIYSGYPFLAHPYNGVFYPLNLLFLIFPVNIGYSWVFALHVFLAGCFMFLLVRYLFKDNFAAFLSAAAFMFSGFTATRIWAGHFELFTASIWIPLIFLLFLKALERKSWLWSIFTGAVLAIQFFAGHNQTSFFTILILLLYIVFFHRNGFFIFAAIMFFFAAFSAIQLFPTLELISLSTRGGAIPFFMSAYGSFPPEHVIRFLAPDIFGNILQTMYAGDPILGEIHWEFTYYIGIIPFILAIYGIVKGVNQKTGKILLYITLFIFAIGGITRIIFLQLWKIANSPSNTGSPIVDLVKFLRMIYTGGISMWNILPFIFIFFIGAWLIFRYIKAKFIDKAKSNSANNEMIVFLALLSLIGLALAFGQYSGGLYYFLYKFIPGYDKFKWPARHLIITNFSLCVLAGYGMMRLNKQIIIKFLLIALLLVDLFWYGSRFLYSMDINEFYPYRRITDILQQEKGMYRVLTLRVVKPGCGYEPSCLEFQANAAIPLHLYNVGGYEPMIIKRYHEFTNIIQGLQLDDFGQAFGQTSIRIKDLSRENLLKLLNVKYVFGGYDLDKCGLDKNSLEVLERSARGEVLLFKNYLPRYMFIQQAKVAKDDADLKNMLTDPNFNPEKSVILEETQSPEVVDDDKDNGYKIDMVNYSSDKVELEITFPGRGYLVSSEIYYPGWRVFVDGKESRIYRSNYSFRAVFVPSAGNHKVEFKFMPDSLRRGSLVTFLSLLFAVFYCLAYLNGKIRNRLKLS